MSIDSADELYEDIRADETDVEEIARRIGWKVSSIAKIKHHLFIQEHWLDQYESLGVPGTSSRFDCDEAIARAWLRLKGGSFGAHDLQLLRHEAAEAWYMRKHGPSYRRAHARPPSDDIRHLLPCGVEPCGSPRSATSTS